MPDGRARNVPPSILGSIARRTASAERHIARWRSTYPQLPQEARAYLAALLLAEDDQVGGR